MKKYMEVFRLSFKMQIVWRFDVAMTMLATVCRILAAWILWRIIFERHTLVSGFTLEGMLSYYIVSAIICSIDFSHQISGEVSELIRGGRFSGHMVTPMNPIGFFTAMSFGETAFHLGFSLIAAFLCSLAFRVNVTLTTNMAQIILASAMIPLGLLFMAGYHYWVGILTFKFLEIGFFMHVQGSIIAFATGSMVPLALLPQTALSILRFLPFSYVAYAPAMLLTGQADAREGLFGLLVITVWTVTIFVTAQLTYHRLRTKYDGVGI